MTIVEFRRWRDFYLDNPFDDHHRYHRPAALVANQMSGIDFKKALEISENKPEEEMSDVDASIFKILGGSPT